MTGTSVARSVGVAFGLGAKVVIALALIPPDPASGFAQPQPTVSRTAGSTDLAVRPEAARITARYFRVRISGEVYQLVEVASGPEQHKAVIDLHGSFVSDRGTIEKVFLVSQVCEAFPEGGPRNYRFQRLLQSGQRWKQTFQHAQAAIVPTELLSLGAFDIGPRTLAEAVKFALTGGASSVRVALGIAKKAATSAIREMSKDPRPYLVTSIHSLLGEAIVGLERFEKKVMEANNSDVLEYDRIVELDNLYWSAVPTGTGAILMYQELSGDLVSNLLRGLANATDQLIQTINDSGEQITSLFLGGEFEKIDELARAQKVFAEERNKWSRMREEERRPPNLAEQIENAVRLAGHVAQAGTPQNWAGMWVVSIPDCGPHACMGHPECEPEGEYRWLSSLRGTFPKFLAYFDSDGEGIVLYDITERRRPDLFLARYGAFVGPFGSQSEAEEWRGPSSVREVGGCVYSLAVWKIVRRAAPLESEERIEGPVRTLFGTVANRGFGNRSSGFALRTDAGQQVQFEFASGTLDQMLSAIEDGERARVEYRAITYRRAGRVVREDQEVLRISPLREESLEVQGWGNSYEINPGRTGFSASSVALRAGGNTVSGSLRYQAFDRFNPSAIVQLFVAVDRTVVATLYQGIPGAGGDSGTKDFSFVYDRSRYGAGATIYLAGTWAMSERVGKYHYEQQGGGWRCPIGRVTIK
jgi:hypothetical protein